MTFEQIHAYLLSEPGAIEDHPFGPEVPVYKIGNKMFAYSSPTNVPPSITIKLDPLLGQMLRSTYEAVQAGYHMNKDHWNTIALNGSIPSKEPRSKLRGIKRQNLTNLGGVDPHVAA